MGEEPFTLGVEEEFQLIDAQSGLLSSGIDRLLEKGTPLLGERIKAELIQSAVELVSPVCPTIADVRRELYGQRTLLTQIAREEGMALLSAGTHPISAWLDQEITERDRYLQLVEEQQDAIRAQIIFGLHIHVGVPDQELAIRLMNQARTWLPHLLALSTNSPFWQGRNTGIKSYRSVLWQSGPRNGIPDALSSRAELDRYMHDMQTVGYVESGSDIWWDVRLNLNFNTIEFRIFDMPATVEDAIALTALCQALIAKLAWLDRQHAPSLPLFPRDYLMENKWQALRYGLDATIADYTRMRRVGMRAAIHDLLDFVDDVVDDLGSRREIQHIRTLLNSPQGTGADRQIAIYQQTGKIQDVVDLLLQQTLRGIEGAPV